MSSSRQVVGLATVSRTAGNPPFVVFAVGMIAKSAGPVGSGVTVSPGNRLPFDWCGQSAPGQRSAKLPPRSASEGTFCNIVEELFSRRHSSEKKKNVLFLFEL